MLSSEKAHEILGHPDGQRTYATAKKLGWTIKNYKDLTNCIPCGKGKMRQTYNEEFDKNGYLVVKNIFLMILNYFWSLQTGSFKQSFPHY